MFKGSHATGIPCAGRTGSGPACAQKVLKPRAGCRRATPASFLATSKMSPSTCNRSLPSHAPRGRPWHELTETPRPSGHASALASARRARLHRPAPNWVPAAAQLQPGSRRGCAGGAASRAAGALSAAAQQSSESGALAGPASGGRPCCRQRRHCYYPAAASSVSETARPPASPLPEEVSERSSGAGELRGRCRCCDRPGLASLPPETPPMQTAHLAATAGQAVVQAGAR